MSDVLRAVEEIVDVLCKHLGPQVLNQDTASDIDIDRHDDFRNEMQEVAADILAIPTLRAALSALEAAGWRVVPVEATEDMLMAGTQNGFARIALSESYRAMLAAAPARSQDSEQ